MTAQLQELQQPTDLEKVASWSRAIDFNLQQIDCLIAIMLKILDGKCQMDEDSRHVVRVVYQHAHGGRSHLFDGGIHDFIQQVFEAPDLLSLRHVHELCKYVETAIPKSVMKGFKQYLWSNIP